MKKKIGTILDEAVLTEAKRRAAFEKRPLSDLFESAIGGYLGRPPGHDEALRALEKFTSHGGLLPLAEVDEILAEDMLLP